MVYDRSSVPEEAPKGQEYGNIRTLRERREGCGTRNTKSATG